MPTAAVKPVTAKQFFSRRGILSQWHPKYEFRPGQLVMAEAVESALATRKHLIVEAGTGTGKTLAYLIPVILSGKRIVISTGTKNLQEQLFYKDIPFLEQHLGVPLRVCYMKGRNNYACRQKIYDADKMPVLSGLEEVADFQIVRDWEPATETGDRAEIRKLPENSTLWAKLDARRDMCSGQKCMQFERCFITLMHQRALDSDIIIVNHHLFFADLALKEEDYGSVIPPYSAVIFDEAHDVEEVAGQYFGVSVSNTQFHDLRRDIAIVARQKNFGSVELDRVLADSEEICERFFQLFGTEAGRWSFREHEAFLSKNGAMYDHLLRAIELVGLQLKHVQTGPDEIGPLLRRVQEYSERLRFWMEEPQSKFVYWAEKRARGCYLQATPIDVSSILEEKLFDVIDTVVLTSATLAVA